MPANGDPDPEPFRDRGLEFPLLSLYCGLQLSPVVSNYVMIVARDNDDWNRAGSWWLILSLIEYCQGVRGY
jgi:hypothetical protein